MIIKGEKDSQVVVSLERDADNDIVLVINGVRVLWVFPGDDNTDDGVFLERCHVPESEQEGLDMEGSVITSV